MAMTGDIRSIKNTVAKGNDDHVEQMRQKIGTEFSSEKRTGKKKGELGKDDFMKLMSAQLKYQDPISPMKNEQMAAQLAQFSALEQMMNVNQNLEKMAQGQKPQEHMIAASLIGKRVSTDSSQFMYEKGKQPEISFNLPAEAATVSMAVVDAKGEVVREIDLGSMKEGKQSVRWDGKNAKAQDQPNGAYSYRVSAADQDGQAIQIKTDSSGLVSGVSFEGGKALLLVEGKKVPIEEIGRIEADAPAAVASAASALAKQASVNALTDETKQKPSSSEPGAKKPTAQVTKKNLPNEPSAEKIKELLSALAPSMGGKTQEVDTESSENETVPMPLWNPNQ